MTRSIWSSSSASLGVIAAPGQAGLVGCARVGCETTYRLTPGTLAEAASWIERVGSRRHERLREHRQR